MVNEVAERRDQYAKALYERGPCVVSWDRCPDRERWLELADAAIATADAEIHKKLNEMQAQALHLVAATEALTEENKRLIKENAALKEGK